MSSSYEYDAVVIGGGAAGLTASGIAANFGAKTMMIERHRLGGDCTWTGCIPSKALLKAGKIANGIRKAGKYGLIDTEPEIDFQKVIRHVHSTRKKVYEDADKPEIFEQMGIDVEFGRASFADEHTVNVINEDGTARNISSRYFFLCAGASPFVPPIPGIEDVDYLTNETLFEIDSLPGKLVIIGAGPIGTEMAQAFNRLGSEVTVIDQADRIMNRDDPELSAMLQQHLSDEGVTYLLGARVESV